MICYDQGSRISFEISYYPNEETLNIVIIELNYNSTGTDSKNVFNFNCCPFSLFTELSKNGNSITISNSSYIDFKVAEFSTISQLSKEQSLKIIEKYNIEKHALMELYNKSLL